MSNLSNLPNLKKIVLKERPIDNPKVEGFDIIEEISRAPNDGEILVQMQALEIGAWIRTTLNEEAFHGSTPIGGTIPALGIGKVLISKSDTFKEGDIVNGPIFAQTHTTMPAEMFAKVENPEIDPFTQIAVLGVTTGLTAYFGIYEVGQVKKDDVVLVSGAAGGVGALVCQLAKIKGAKVIGVAGGKEKCEVLVNEIGADAAIDYKKDNLDEKIKEFASEGIDIFFDNVGGEILDAALDNIRDRARVVICGAISQYSHHDSVNGPSLYLRLAEKYSRMEGFTVMHFEDRYQEASKELLSLYEQGKLKIPYHIEDGIENFPLALQKLFTGGNTGKLMVKA
ncbi:MAG: NADP-dependent oxidoreductase [Rhodobiaceae bacterium]|nr:NADP-dependent oxidoreductase [Rhodobiaceae bacterium]